ncbi:MAG: prepilin-type N-terminal cleavage/methylation domain-containing protein [Gammaproteobacteria bacterium]|nr:prepilin-type N-terminal cleavage/methylation domain-containing protein [Gammaproteobacteria bacterium]
MISRGALKNSVRGFTLVELLVVIAIAAIIAVIAAPSVTRSLAMRRTQAAAFELRTSILQARSLAASIGRPVELWPAYSSTWNVPVASRTGSPSLPAAEANAATIATLTAAQLSWYVVSPCVAASATTCPTTTTTAASIANSTANNYPIQVSLPDQTVITVGTSPSAVSPNATIGLRFFPNGYIGNIKSTTSDILTQVSFRICDSAVSGIDGYTVLVGAFGTVRAFSGRDPDTTDTVGNAKCP